MTAAGRPFKRFLLFAGEGHYAAGGWLDFQSSHDTLEQAKAVAATVPSWTMEWWHVVDATTGEIVHERGRALMGDT